MIESEDWTRRIVLASTFLSDVPILLLNIVYFVAIRGGPCAESDGGPVAVLSLVMTALVILCNVLLATAPGLFHFNFGTICCHRSHEGGEKGVALTQSQTRQPPRPRTQPRSQPQRQPQPQTEGGADCLSGAVVGRAPAGWGAEPGG